MAFAREISDAVLFIDGGRIQVAGAPREVLVDPTHERLRAFLSRLNPEQNWEATL
jgi:polar amino acid transport system ATP-binding protein